MCSEIDNYFLALIEIEYNPSPSRLVNRHIPLSLIGSYQWPHKNLHVPASLFVHLKHSTKFTSVGAVRERYSKPLCLKIGLKNLVHVIPRQIIACTETSDSEIHKASSDDSLIKKIKRRYLFPVHHFYF